MRMPVSIDFVLALRPEVCSASSSRRLAPIFVQQNILQDEPGDASDANNSDKGLDARVPTRLASCLRAALRTLQLALVRIFPAAAGKSAVRGRRGPGTFLAVIRAAHRYEPRALVRTYFVRNRAEAAGVGAAQTAWKRRQSGSSSRAICSEYTRVWVLGAESLSQT